MFQLVSFFASVISFGRGQIVEIKFEYRIQLLIVYCFELFPLSLVFK